MRGVLASEKSDVGPAAAIAAGLASRDLVSISSPTTLRLPDDFPTTPRLSDSPTPRPTPRLPDPRARCCPIAVLAQAEGPASGAHRGRGRCAGRCAYRFIFKSGILLKQKTCGEGGAVPGEAKLLVQEGIQRQEEMPACGEGGAASAASWKGSCCLWRIWQGWCCLSRSAEKTQGGSVSRGRDRGEKETENNRFGCAALRRAFSLQPGVLYQMRFSPTAQSVHGASPPAEWFVVAGRRRASRPAGVGLPSVREGCGRRAEKF